MVKKPKILMALSAETPCDSVLVMEGLTGPRPHVSSAEKTTLGKTAIIDIDNTLWQFSDAFYLELKKINRDFPPPDQWCTYDALEEHCSVEDFMAAINAVHHHQDSDRYRPYPESQHFLASLKEKGFYVIIASHRTPETRQPTERWLARHGLSYDQLYLSFDKTVLFSRAAIVVDDSPLTLEKAIESGLRGAGLSFPWNRNYPSNGFRLFQNLTEVLDYILTDGNIKNHPDGSSKIHSKEETG